MRGRKPRPTARKVLTGNPGRRRLNVEEPQPAAVDASTFDVPPPELDGLVVAAAYWTAVAPGLRKSRQVTEADRAALVALCVEWDRYIEARAKAYPRVVKSASGYPMPNPWLAIQTKALASCLKLWPELGLTPSSRSRVHVSGAAPESAAARFKAAAPKLRMVSSR